VDIVLGIIKCKWFSELSKQGKEFVKFIQILSTV